VLRFELFKKNQFNMLSLLRKWTHVTCMTTERLGTTFEDADWILVDVDFHLKGNKLPV
jgi:hypothetical protein